MSDPSNNEKFKYILRDVTDQELLWIKEILKKIKNGGDGYGEIIIFLRQGKINKIKSTGEEIINIYKDQ